MSFYSHACWIFILSCFTSTLFHLSTAIPASELDTNITDIERIALEVKYGTDFEVEEQEEKGNETALDFEQPIIEAISSHATVPPTILHPMTDEPVYANTERRREIKCSAEGYPKPILTWYKDGLQVSPSNPRTMVLANGNLVLDGFESQDNGYYQCRATNKAGTSLSPVRHIVKQEGSEGYTSNEVFNVDESSPFSLPCDNIPDTVMVMQKRWYDTFISQIRIDGRVGVDLNGTLHFAYTKRTDSKKYMCGLIGITGFRATEIPLFGKGQLVVSPVRDDVGKEKPIEEIKPSLMYTVSNKKAIIGRKAILECVFSGFPLPKITWKNSSNHDVTTGNPRFQVDDFGRKLVIKVVKQQDEGVFTCNGTNKLGHVTQTINVNVTTPPMRVARKSLTSSTVPDRDGVATLYCETQAAANERLDTPRWYKNGEPLTKENLPPRYKFDNTFTQLQISDLDKEKDTANFQCNTSNSEGYKFFDSYLRVISSILVTKKPLEFVRISHGDVVDITIEATGDECCTTNMLWYFNDSLIASPAQFPPFQIQENQVLFNSSRTESKWLWKYLGDYKVRVSNPHDYVDVAFYLVPEGSYNCSEGRCSTPFRISGNTTPVPVTSSYSKSFWWIGLVCGLLLIFIAIIVVVALYKSNNPGSTYKLEQQELKHNLNPEEDLLNQSFHEI